MFEFFESKFILWWIYRLHSNFLNFYLHCCFWAALLHEFVIVAIRTWRDEGVVSGTLPGGLIPIPLSKLGFSIHEKENIVLIVNPPYKGSKPGRHHDAPQFLSVSAYIDHRYIVPPSNYPQPGRRARQIITEAQTGERRKDLLRSIISCNERSRLKSIWSHVALISHPMSGNLVKDID